MDDSQLSLGLTARGWALYNAVTESNTLDPGAQILLEEACRSVDRLEQLHWILKGDNDRWISLSEEAEEMFDTTRVEIVMNNALTEVRQQQLALRQILTTLGLGRTDPKATAEDDLFTRLDKAMHPEKYEVDANTG
jgi:hypothetical protein